MPAKKNNENPLYIKQIYKPNHNNGLALRTAYGTTNKQAQPHPSPHKHAHDVRTRKRAGDRKSGPSSQEEKISNALLYINMSMPCNDGGIS